MFKSCTYCGGIHDVKYQCPKKPKRDKKKDTDANKFRNTKAWQRKREYIKQRDKHLCQACVLEGRYTPWDSIHHIVSVHEDYDMRSNNYNLIALCREHPEEAERGDISKEKLQKIAKENEENYFIM